MGATLAALEARGLVERRPDPRDGRRVVLSVTEAGRDVLRDKRNARAEQLAQALSAGFTPAELRQLMAVAPLLERLAQSI
jgi:DNA-binding MarR family transcriptional regulator